MDLNELPLEEREDPRYESAVEILRRMEELEDDAASIWKRIKQCAEADPEFVTWLKKTVADNDGGDPQTVHHKRMSSSVLKSLQEKVHKLMDDSYCIGSFICVGPSTGICTMHQVLRGSKILQDTLSVSGHQVVHVVSYPYYDFSIYSVLLKDDEPPLQYFDFEPNSIITAGTDVFLAGYPRLDSQEEEEDIVVTYGPISRTALRADSPVALAQYPAFANSSGGAVVSSRGRLVGIHLESYHTEYHDYYRGPQSPFDDPEISDSCEVRSLQWEEFILHDDPDVKLAATDVKDLARHAVCNMGEKGMLGGFLPVNYLRLKLKNEGIISKQSTKTKRRRKV